MTRTFTQIKDSTNDIRRQMGMPYKPYAGTSRTAILIAEGRLRRALKMWTEEPQRVREMTPNDFAAMFALSEKDAEAFYTNVVSR